MTKDWQKSAFGRRLTMSWNPFRSSNPIYCPPFVHVDKYGEGGYLKCPHLSTWGEGVKIGPRNCWMSPYECFVKNNFLENVNTPLENTSPNYETIAHSNHDKIELSSFSQELIFYGSESWSVIVTDIGQWLQVRYISFLKFSLSLSLYGTFLGKDTYSIFIIK